MIFSVESLGVERGGRMVLANLSFAAAAGEAVLVTGRNGAGKSTLLRAIAGLLPVHSGTIRFAHADAEIRVAETIHYLGYEDALKPSLSVRENLDFWAAMLGPGDGMTPKQALSAFGIARLLDLPAAYLSAGQKRRVALARLLLASRPLWLLDEPLIALDLSAQETLAAIMARHVAGGGVLIAASHAPLGIPARVLDLASAG